jgi:3-hydroxyacyl-CoA dehydrogenase
MVSNQLANVLSGGATDMTEIVSEDRVMELERGAFMTLVKTEATLSRIEVMLATGKPLRN